MFNEQDFVNYFTELESIERNMSDTYSAALRTISDTKVKKALSSIYQDEIKHSRMVGEIRRMAIDKTLKTS